LKKKYFDACIKTSVWMDECVKAEERAPSLLAGDEISDHRISYEFPQQCHLVYRVLGIRVRVTKRSSTGEILGCVQDVADGYGVLSIEPAIFTGFARGARVSGTFGVLWCLVVSCDAVARTWMVAAAPRKNASGTTPDFFLILNGCRMGRRQSWRWFLAWSCCRPKSFHLFSSYTLTE
jgi:hypothetical protein